MPSEAPSRGLGDVRQTRRRNGSTVGVTGACTVSILNSSTTTTRLKTTHTRLHTLGHNSTLVPTRSILFSLRQPSDQRRREGLLYCSVTKVLRKVPYLRCTKMYSKKKNPWQPVHDRHDSTSTHPGYIAPVLYTLGVDIQYMSGTSLVEPERPPYSSRSLILYAIAFICFARPLYAQRTLAGPFFPRGWLRPKPRGTATRHPVYSTTLAETTRKLFNSANWLHCRCKCHFLQ